MSASKLFLFNVLLAVLFISGCANGQDSKVKNLSQNEFKKVFDNKKGSQIIDVRTPEEISQGKITLAHEVNYFDADFQKKVEKLNLDKSKPVVVYCAVGGRSSKAAEVLIKMGFKNVLNLEGGYNSYK